MPKQSRSLSGKVAVITGGGRGIGRATAEALVREGVRVAIGDVDTASAEQTAAELGDAVIGLHLDVTDLPGFTAFLDEVEQRLGPVDVLINNAGIMPITPLEQETEASINRQLEINLRAVIHGTQEAMRRMKPRQTGHIVNIASQAGKRGYKLFAHYCASKAAGRWCWPRPAPAPAPPGCATARSSSAAGLATAWRGCQTMAANRWC